MRPKLIALAARRWSFVTSSGAHVEDFRRGRAVDVAFFRKGAPQALVTREVRHDPKLDLRIVGRQQHLAFRRDERLADAPALQRADRDVLQVRVAGRQPARDGDRLVIRGVHAPGLRVDLLGQLLGVGRAQLREAAVLQDDARQRIACSASSSSTFFGGGGLAGARFLPHRQALLVEQDFLQLLRRIEVERLAGRLVGLDLELGEALRDFAALLLQQLAVDEHAAVLHLEQHRHERLLDLLVDREQGRVLFERGMQDAVQLQRDVRVFGRVLGRPARPRTWLKVICFAPLPATSSYLIVSTPR